MAIVLQTRLLIAMLYIGYKIYVKFLIAGVQL